MKTTCSQDGCDEPSRSRGMCAKHYRRWYRSLDPEGEAERTREWRSRNRKKFREYHARYRREHRDDLNRKGRIYNHTYTAPRLSESAVRSLAMEVRLREESILKREGLIQQEWLSGLHSFRGVDVLRLSPEREVLRDLDPGGWLDGIPDLLEAVDRNENSKLRMKELAAEQGRHERKRKHESIFGGPIRRWKQL